jgi:hypothetical protein
MSQKKLIFSNKSQSVIDFVISLGANTIKLIKNPHTKKNFFVVDGTEMTGRVSKEITSLSPELRVTWVDVEGGTEEDSSYMLHLPGSDENTLDTLSCKG